MIDGPFRSILPRYSAPLLKLYAKAGLTPNQVTVIGFLLGLAAAVLVFHGFFYSAIFLWWLGRLFDGTDGIYARSTNQVSPFGGYLDIVLDMAAYGAMVIGFAGQFPELSLTWTVIEFLYILCITSALALGAIEREMNLSHHDNRTLRLASGLAEGGETGLAYTLFLVFPAYLNLLTTAWIVILFLTILARTFLARKILALR
jgi:phosphatidylglycerophosphate synthase